MFGRLRPYLISLFFTWIALGAAAIVYSRQHPHSTWILSSTLPAFLCESTFYLASIFKETRELFRKLRLPRVQAFILLLTGLIPYLVLSLAAGAFNRNAFYLLAALTAAVSFWYAVLPRRAAYDIGFLVIAAAPQITRVFNRLYVSPDPQISVLGHLAWIHVGIIALLVLREWNPGEFSFWPTPKEFQIGMVLFLLGIAPIAALAVSTHAVHFVAPNTAWWRMAGTGIGTFFGILWVVALSEELFFRGFIQRGLEKYLHNPFFAIVIASLLFGSVHLWVHQFPNWPQAVVASALGLACGIAYWWAGSVRASMVTHAFVVVAWRLFFKEG